MLSNTILLMIAAAFIAFFIKGLCGFANTLVFTTILGFSIDNANISPMEVILGYPSNVIIAWNERKNIKWKLWLPMAMMVILGSLPGAILLKIANAQVVKIIFGFVVIAISIEMLWKEHLDSDGSIKKSKNKFLISFMGIAAGALCGIYGVGALLAVYVNRVTENSHDFKGNLCMVFIVENTFRIIVYSLTGLITLQTMKMAGILLPVMLIGLFLGMKSSKILDEKQVKKVVIVLLIISGIALIIVNF